MPLPPDHIRLTYASSPNHEDEGFTQHRWRALVHERTVGLLTVNQFDHVSVTESVEVDPEYRRRGIAKRLLRTAEAKLGEIQHSEWQTADGRAWVAAVGGKRHGDPSTWTDS